MTATALKQSTETRRRDSLFTSDSWDAVVAPVGPFLAETSERLMAQVDSFEPEIAGYARYALESQGKRLRPALVALAAGSVGQLGDGQVTIAVIIEMIHLATLVHDDIMDQAILRRRRPTLSSSVGNDVAVLLGDCLFARALELAAGFPTTDVCRSVAASTKTVCTGEILQTHRRRRWNLSRPDYFQVLEMKTAELFALACELGGADAGANPAQRSALRRFGMDLGIAYQIYDDCLDLYGVEGEAGKTLGMDFAGGKLTLPAILFLEEATPEERARLEGWLEHWLPTRLAEARQLLETRDALGTSVRILEDRLAAARGSLSELPANPCQIALNTLADFLSHRMAALSAG